MFELVVLFLISLAIGATAAIAIRLYRFVSKKRSSRYVKIRDGRAPTRINLKAQYGFINLGSSSRQSAKRKTVYSSKKNIKAPWDW